MFVQATHSVCIILYYTYLQAYSVPLYETNNTPMQPVNLNGPFQRHNVAALTSSSKQTMSLS